MYDSSNDALAATRFRETRRRMGDPVATAEQTRRAAELIRRNPLLRRHDTPLGVELLALSIPLTRRERMANRRSAEDGGLALVLTPTRVRSQAPVSDRDAVERFVDSMPDADERGVAEAVVATFGYAGDVGHVVRRLERYARSPRQRRLAGHLRAKAVMMDAVAYAITLVRAREAVA